MVYTANKKSKYCFTIEDIPLGPTDRAVEDQLCRGRARAAQLHYKSARLRVPVA